MAVLTMRPEPSMAAEVERAQALAASGRATCADFERLVEAACGAGSTDALREEARDQYEYEEMLSHAWYEVAVAVGMKALPGAMEAAKRARETRQDAHTRQWNGYTVYDGVLTFLALLEAHRSRNGMERQAVMSSLLFDRPDVPAGTLSAAMRELFGFGTKGGRQVMDWESDLWRVKASLRMAYGFVWDEEAPKTSFEDVQGMLRGLMEAGNETPIREAVRYRSPMPHGMSEGQQRAWRERAEHFSLDDDERDPYGDELLRRRFG